MLRCHRPFAALAALAVLSGCGGDSAGEDVPPDREDVDAGIEEAGPSSPGGAGPSLTFADLPDGCDVLTQDRAAEMLEAAVTRRPGGDCAWSAPGSRFVRLLYSDMPLERFDSRRDDRGTLAAMLGQIARLGAPPEFVGMVDGGPAFAAEKEQVSVLFAVPGVNTTAMLSDREVGEVLVQVSIETDRPHAERVRALQELAGEAVAAIRRLSSGAGGRGASVTQDLPDLAGLAEEAGMSQRCPYDAYPLILALVLVPGAILPARVDAHLPHGNHQLAVGT